MLVLFFSRTWRFYSIFERNYICDWNRKFPHFDTNVTTIPSWLRPRYACYLLCACFISARNWRNRPLCRFSLTTRRSSILLAASLFAKIRWRMFLFRCIQKRLPATARCRCAPTRKSWATCIDCKCTSRWYIACCGDTSAYCSDGDTSSVGVPCTILRSTRIGSVAVLLDSVLTTSHSTPLDTCATWCSTLPCSTTLLSRWIH